MDNRMQSGEGQRRIISLALFVIGVILAIVGLVTDLGLTGVLLGVVLLLAGYLFYRRGK